MFGFLVLNMIQLEFPKKFPKFPKNSCKIFIPEKWKNPPIIPENDPFLHDILDVGSMKIFVSHKDSDSYT